MTISYAKEVANGSSFGCFWKILLKWRGSVYKLVWRELLAYLFLYYSLNFMYRYALNNNQKRVFENIRLYFGSQSESIPMSFVLGFYVSLVVKRWWDQYKLLPWPDTLALYISAGLPGSDERGRLMRRNIVRYAVLAYVITLMRVSLRVKRRFPTWQHVVDSGLMLESEKKIFELMDDKTPMSKYWMPLVWATNIINRARKESLIVSDHIVQTLLVELSDIRRRLGALIGYDTVCVPLVYTQVVTLALYTYFISVLMGRQFVDPPDKSGDNKNTELEYFPFFTVLQFCFYVGWLKVAEVLINPFGEDDDDIELNWLIDRHIKAAYIIVDEMHEEHPELLKDQYWEEVVPKELPYTVASEHYRREEPKGSAEHYKVKESDAMYANLMPNHRKHTAIPDDMYADYESVDTPLVERRKNWFARQITRMGSVRSASTAYSSGGLFGGHRTRHNSVYSSPESGLVPGGQHPPVLQHKMSLYDRLVGRKSGRNIMHGRQLSRPSIPKLNINGATVTLKNRPRIPTPDVTKELVLERENKLTTTSATVGQGVTLMAHQLATAASGGPPTGYTGYTGNDLPVVQVVLSPIQELQDGSGSRNSTLHAGQPATAALAQAVLASPGLTGHSVQGVTYTPVTVSSMALTPVTMSQLNSLGLTTITSTSEPGSLKNISSISLASPNITFTATNPTISLVSSTRTDTDSDSGTELHTPPPPPTSAPPQQPLTITELSEEEAGSESSLTVSNSHEQDRSRKTSVTSQQTNGGGQKRGEVYV